MFFYLAKAGCGELSVVVIMKQMVKGFAAMGAERCLA